MSRNRQGVPMGLRLEGFGAAKVDEAQWGGL
jgi:hypothetical protein